MNILFGASQACSAPLPCTLNGEVDHTGVGVNFTSTTQLLDQDAKGQADITSTNPPNSLSAKTGTLLTELTITIPGYTFGDFIMNPLNGIGNATVTATGNFNHAFNYDLGNGQNYLTITTANGESIASLSISVACLATDATCLASALGPGFIEFKQPRVSEVCSEAGCLPTPVPEPTSLLLLGSGLIGLAGAARRRMKGRN